jgi:hypothetical protein
MRKLGYLAAALVALVPLAGSALDAPHDGSFTDNNCDNCHSLYTNSGSGQLNYNAGCTSCHNARPASTRGFPWLTSDQAMPAQGGNQHSWTGFAVNPSAGTVSPSSPDVAKRLVDGKLQCATCHDAHNASAANQPGSIHTSITVGAAVDEAGGPPEGTAKMTLVAPGTAAKGYRLQIQTATATGGTFVISHDAGLAAPTWANWNGTAWAVGTATGPGKPFTNDTPVALDDAAVTVQWSAGAAPGNYWDFYVSYPFVRASNVDDAFCTMCHSAFVMDSTKVEGNHPYYKPDGKRLFSHPVGEAPNANGKRYDRPDILDANGDVQSVGDGNTTNDLGLRNGVVRCTTCHAAHNADSNSLTLDAR